VFGVMPEHGIRKLLGDRLPDPGMGRGIPRAELYLRVDEPISSIAGHWPKERSS
jgi:hypothetical protein